MSDRAHVCGCDSLVSVMEHNDHRPLVGGWSPRSGADARGPVAVGLLTVCLGQASPSPRASVPSSVERGYWKAYVKYDV